MMGGSVEELGSGQVTVWRLRPTHRQGLECLADGCPVVGPGPPLPVCVSQQLDDSSACC